MSDTQYESPNFTAMEKALCNRWDILAEGTGKKITDYSSVDELIKTSTAMAQVAEAICATHKAIFSGF